MWRELTQEIRIFKNSWELLEEDQLDMLPHGDIAHLQSNFYKGRKMAIASGSSTLA